MSKSTIDGELFKEWLDHPATKAFKTKLDELRMESLESIVVNVDKEEACGIVKGIALVISLLESAKEDGL